MPDLKGLGLCQIYKGVGCARLEGLGLCQIYKGVGCARLEGLGLCQAFRLEELFMCQTRQYHQSVSD